MATQLVLTGGGLIGSPPRIGNAMADEPPDDKPRDDDIFLLTPEDNSLAQLLGGLQQADFARILNQLSPEAKDELRSAIGLLQAKASFREEPDKQ